MNSWLKKRSQCYPPFCKISQIHHWRKALNRYKKNSPSWPAYMKSLHSVVEGQLSEMFKRNNDSIVRDLLTHTIRKVWAEDTTGHSSVWGIWSGEFHAALWESPKENKSIFIILPRNFSLCPTLNLSCKSDWTNIGFFTFSSFVELVPFQSVI